MYILQRSAPYCLARLINGKPKQPTIIFYGLFSRPEALPVQEINGDNCLPHQGPLWGEGGRYSLRFG